MRKWGCLLAVLLTLLCGQAQAQPEYAPYDLTLSLRYRTLTAQQQALFDRLYDAVWQGETSFTCPPDTDYQELSMLVSLLCKDMPELCALDGSVTFHYYRDHPETAIGLTLDYLLPIDSQEALFVRAAELVQSVRGSTYVRELALHDLVCEQVTYQRGANPHSAYGALAEGQAVCEGYAKAFALLCRLSGIPCSVVEGESVTPGGWWENHAWNLVEVDGVTAWVDVTWDDQEELLHWYVNLNDELLLGDHRLAAGQAVPACPSDAWEWHRVNGCVIPAENSYERLYAELEHLVRNDDPIDVRFADEAAFREVADAFPEVWDAYNQGAAPEMGLYGSLTWSSRDSLQVLRVRRSDGTGAKDAQ